MSTFDLLDLARHAKRQGETAARYGAAQADNPFDPDTPGGRAWEAGRADEIERRIAGDLLAWRQRKRRAS